MVLLLQLFPDFKGLFRRRNADEILQEKAVVELWGMLVSNFWQLLNMQLNFKSSPAGPRLLQVRRDACISDTLKWGRQLHS